MKTKFLGVAVTLMAALIALVGCQKDPDTASANIEIYAESLEAKPEGWEDPAPKIKAYIDSVIEAKRR